MFVLSPEVAKRAREAFMAALDDALPAYELGQLKLFHDDDEQFIRKEVERRLYEPQLPAAGQKERRMIERLKLLALDTEWQGHQRAAFAVTQWERVLPGDPRNAGRYYTRKPMSPKADKEGYEWTTNLRDAAHVARQWDKKWFAEMLLAGMPKPVSNFEMECLFLLRKSDGTVDRLVRLRNILGEVSKGPHHKGSDVLDAKAFTAPEKFREWALARGNFAWGGNQDDLHKLQEDNTHASAWRVINQVDSVGWMGIGKTVKQPDGQRMQMGLWFCEECAYADGVALAPDDDGIYWWNGEGYYLNRKGRESNFAQGKPKMQPGQVLVLGAGNGGRDVPAPGQWQLAARALPAGGEELVAARAAEREVLTKFYRELCAKFYDTIGGYEAWLAMGAMFAYAAAPEIWEDCSLFSGLWIHGQMESGKTKFTEWLMRLWGFQCSAGMGLLKSTAVGLLQETENYSDLPLWVDEYRAGRVTEDKEAVLRDSYNRQPPVKWSPDGIQRQMRTSFVVSGESTSSDSALRSRFPHVQVSASKRKANHLHWFEEHKQFFFVFGRFLLENRTEFVGLVRKNLEAWGRTQEFIGLNEREKLVHGIDWASWMAMCGLLESHGAEETRAFKAAMVAHVTSSAADVTSETNINVFLTDLLTAFKADKLPLKCFSFDVDHASHPPDRPNQRNGWKSYRLFIDPDATIAHMAIFLGQQKQSVTLRRKDLRDQLSKTPFWVEGSPVRRFGGANTRAWGFHLDKMEGLGYLPCTDEAAESYLLKEKEGDQDGDPRKGPYFAIIEALESARDAAR